MENKISYHWKLVESAVAGELVMPLTCEVDPSNRCMLNCQFCLYEKFLKARSVDLEMNIFLMLIKEAAPKGLKSITFTGGGEPLMSGDYNEMANMAYLAGLEIGLVTNGVLLEKVHDPKSYKFIRVSLDAADRETYFRIKGQDLFNRVISNIEKAVRQEAFVGISYVVNELNSGGIEAARCLAERLGVRYIQFKPAWNNGQVYEGFKEAVGEADQKKIITDRYVATDNLPCKIAGLIGVLAADGYFYYCCQHRGKREYRLGSLMESNYESILKRRQEIEPKILRCPRCRYMNYAVKYRQLVEENRMNIDHINFL